MAREVKPKAILLAETRMLPVAEREFLEAIGAPDWDSDGRNGERLVEIAGKLCYMAFDKQLNLNLTRTGTRNNTAYIQQQLIAPRHGSVLEHATVTFALLNVSRVFTHELVRHRVGIAYSQVSGRYVRTDRLDYYLPPEIERNHGAMELFHAAFSDMERYVKELTQLLGLDGMTDFGLKKRLTSAMRRIVGNGQANHIMVTANHRTWRHLIETRTDPAAESEIREVFSMIYSQLQERYPAFYADARVDDTLFPPAIRFDHQKI